MFQETPEFQDGEVLCKLAYAPLFDNDQFFYGFAERYRAVAQGVKRRYIGNETELIVWDGYLLLQADATDIQYYISLANDDAGHPSTLTLFFDYGGVGQAEVDQLTATGYAQDTFDASGYAAGLYRITCILTRDIGDNNYNATAVGRAVYATYTGALSYSAPPAISDGLLSSAASHFNVWRANDLYFQAQMSPNHPHVAFERTWVGDELDLIVWDGWVVHSGEHERIYYKAKLSGVSDGDTLQGYYDYGGGDQEMFVEITDAALHESYADLTPATFADGTMYRVTWRLTRTSHIYNNDVTLYYAFLAPGSAGSGFTIPGDLAAGQYVFGDTAGQDTKANILSDNDTHLNGRQTLVRRDYAVRKAEYEDLGESGGTWWYTFHRQRDLLYYRGSGLMLTWGDDESLDLEEYDGDNPYWILDLRQLETLLPGSNYEISGSDLQFATEL